MHKMIYIHIYIYAMVEVISGVTGDSIAIFEDVGLSVKALKQRLALQTNISRFRLRLLENHWPLDDDQTLTTQVVKLVMLNFEPPDREADREFLVACETNEDQVLEAILHRPRNPNFEDENGITPLYAAALRANLSCVSLLLEAGANKEHGAAKIGVTPLFIAAQEGHLEVVRLLVQSGANTDHSPSEDGATPLLIAAEGGHLDIVRFLVGSGANKDQSTTDDGSTPLLQAAM